MATQKIRYDIEAAVTGGSNVNALATSLEGLANTLEGDLKVQALASAAALRQLGEKQGAIDSFKKLKTEAQDAAGRLKEAQAAAQQLGQSLSGAATPTRAQSGELQKLRDSVRAAKAEVIAKTAALDQSRGALRNYGIGTDGLAQSERNVRAALAATGDEVRRLVPGWAAAGQAAAASGQQQARAAADAKSGLAGLGEQLRNIQNIAIAAMGGGFVGGLVKDIGQTADAYTNLTARLRLVTGEGDNFKNSLADVTRVAMETNTSIETTATLFGRLAAAGKSAGQGAVEAQEAALGITETINQAVIVSGATAQSGNAAITQLIQGLQSGVLRGEEFNSVMEQAPRLATALADGLGVTTGELRKMANQGQLTTDVVVTSLKSQAETLRTEYASMPLTIGAAIQNLSTAWLVYVGETDQATGASLTAANAIGALATNLKTVADLLLDVGQAGAAFVALRLAQGFLGIGAAAAAAATGVGAAGAAGAGAAAALGSAGTASAGAATGLGAAGAAATRAAAGLSAAGAAAAGAAAGLGAAGAAGGAAAAGLGAAGAAGVNRFAGAFAGLGAAANAAGAAATGAVATAGRFAALIAGFKLVALAVIVSNFKDIGTWIGEGIAKLQGYKDKTAELEVAEKSRLMIAKEQRLVVEAQAAAMRVAMDAQFALSKAAQGSILEFDKLTKGGKSAADAIKEIGKDFDLSKSAGIRDAVTVLDKLVASGKLTAVEFRQAWADALKGEDLLQFETRFKAAMLQMQADADKAAQAVRDAIARGVGGKELQDLQDKAEKAFTGMQREAERTAQVMEATLAEAVRRTGLSMELISGGMGKAAASAINDLDRIVTGLDDLKEKGVDVGRVLEAGLTKALNTADGQKALDEVKARIESVRKVLGDKVADGLLDQAKQKAQELSDALDKAKPGINSVAEAMKVLGVTSEESLKKTAVSFKSAYDTMAADGKTTARELADAFKKAADAAIAANNGIAPSWVTGMAAVRGYTVQVDAAGKATLVANDATKKSGDIHNNTAGSVQKHTTALGRLNAERDREISALEKANDLKERAEALERKRLGVDKQGFAADKDGNRITQSIQTKRSVFENAKSQGLTEAQALQLSDQFIDERGRQTGYGNANFNRGGNWGTELQKAIDKLVFQNARSSGQMNGGASPPGARSASAPGASGARSVVVELRNGSATERITTDESGAAALVRSLKNASLVSSR